MPIGDFRQKKQVPSSEYHANIEAVENTHITKIAVIDVDGCLFNQHFFALVESNLVNMLVQEKRSGDFPQSKKLSLFFKKIVKESLFAANQVFFEYLQREGFTEFFNGSARQSAELDIGNGYLSFQRCLQQAQRSLPGLCKKLKIEVTLQEEVTAFFDTILKMPNRFECASSFTTFYIFPLIAEKYNLTYLKFLSPDVYSKQPIGSTYASFKTKPTSQQARNIFDESKVLDLLPKLNILSGKSIVAVFDDRQDIIDDFNRYFSANPTKIPAYVESLDLYIYVSAVDVDKKVNDITEKKLELIGSINGSGPRRDAYALTRALAKATFTLALEARAKGHPAQQFINPSTSLPYKTYAAYEANQFNLVCLDSNNPLEQFNALSYIDALPDAFFDQFNLTSGTDLRHNEAPATPERVVCETDDVARRRSEKRPYDNVGPNNGAQTLFSTRKMSTLKAEAASVSLALAGESVGP